MFPAWYNQSCKFDASFHLRSEAAESAPQFNCSFEVGSFDGQVASIRAACRSGYAPLDLVVLGTLSNIAVIPWP